MIERPTVIVLGAGASTEFGLPTGVGLANDIAVRAAFYFTDGVQTGGDPDLYNAFNSDPQFRDRLFLAGRLISRGLPMARSVDDFLYNHDEDKLVLDLGKAAIVQSILAAERDSYLFEAFSQNQDDPEQIFDRIAHTWQYHLFSFMHVGVKRSDIANVFRNLSIINFNYDRCVEELFPYLLNRAYGVSIEEGRDATQATLDITHVYGRVGNLPWHGQGQTAPYVNFGSCVTGKSLRQLSSGIRTFTEQAQDPDEIEHCRSILGAAEQVIFLGFGFHRQNMALLSLDSPRWNTALATGYKVSLADQSVFKRRVMEMFKNSDLNVEVANITANDLIRNYGLRIAG